MQNNQVKNKKETALQQLGMARKNLLLMIILTAVNVVLYALGTNTMLLFSATVPYFITVIGLASSYTATAVFCFAVAAIILLLYLLCWVFSKKHYGFMIAALVLFIIDTAAMVLLYVLMKDFSGILDVLIHIWVLFYLIIGVKNGIQLKKLTPEDEMEYEAAQLGTEYEGLTKSNSEPLRTAYYDEKFRVLAEANVEGMEICYRRVKRVNELVVNGYVYDEVEMMIETSHQLSAFVGGHDIVAGYNGAVSYILLDGKEIERKLRLV